jgi:hypothetical protein
MYILSVLLSASLLIPVSLDHKYIRSPAATPTPSYIPSLQFERRRNKFELFALKDLKAGEEVV